MTGKTIARYPGAMLRGDHCRLVGFLVVLVTSTTAFGWGGPSHSMLAGNIFNDPIISGFATEFSVDVNAVTSWTSEPPSDWHHPGWSMVKARGYLGTYNGKDWTSLTETTRLRYLTHILMDAGVPVSHSPANTVYTSTFNEGVLEAQASTWSDSPNISGTSFTGTITSVNNTFESQCISNAQAFKNTRNWLGLHSVDDNRHYGWIGQTLALKMSRAVLADYFLAKRNTIAEAGSGYIATPGNSVTFNSAGSQDPDSITWNSNGTYYNNGGGISSVAWDLDNDGAFDDASGSTAAVTHSQLASLAGYSETGKTIRVQVTDNEGKASVDSATVKIFSNPVADAGPNQRVYYGQKLRLTNSGYDPDGGGISLYEWDLNNDGIFGSYGSAPVVAWNTLTSLGMTVGQGNTIGKKVTDNDGAYAGTGTDTAVITLDAEWNIAPLATPAVDSIHPSVPTYDQWNLIDQDFTCSTGAWVSYDTEPHWITLTWEDEMLINQVKLYSIGYDNPAYDPGFTIADFQIQVWENGAWQTVESVTDNTDVVYTWLSGTTYETDKIRIWITQSNYTDPRMRLLEVEAGYTDGMQPIPEPATLSLLATCGMLGLRKRRRK